MYFNLEEKTVLGARRHSLSCAFMLEIIEDLLGYCVFTELKLCPWLQSVHGLKQVRSQRVFHLVLFIVENKFH